MASMSNVEIKFQVVSLDDVLRYFAKDFEVKDGQRIIATQHFVDTAKNAVVFKLTVENT